MWISYIRDAQIKIILDFHSFAIFQLKRLNRKDTELSIHKCGMCLFVRCRIITGVDGIYARTFLQIINNNNRKFSCKNPLISRCCSKHSTSFGFSVQSFYQWRKIENTHSSLNCNQKLKLSSECTDAFCQTRWQSIEK